MKKTFISLLLTVLLLAACAAQAPAETDPETVPAAQVTERPTEPPTVPETEMPTEPPTDPPLDSGSPVSLLGKDTESFLEGDTLYVRAEDFAQAFDLNLSLTEGEIFLDGEPLGLAALIRMDGEYVPLRSLAEALSYGIFVDETLDGRTYVYPASGTDIPEGITVPVLMYHAISDDIWGIRELFVSPSDMDAQLNYLVENGYEPIFFSDLTHVEDYDKPVILTFDDGYDDNYSELFPLLQKYQVKATVFIITDAIGGNHKMTAEQILEMSQSGLVSVQSHTATHPYLDELSEEELISELERSQLAITRLTGIQPDVLCYPSGKRNALVKEVAARYYNYALIMGPSGYVTGDDPYVIGRYYVSRDTGLSEFAWMVSAAGDR